MKLYAVHTKAGKWFSKMLVVAVAVFTLFAASCANKLNDSDTYSGLAKAMGVADVIGKSSDSGSGNSGGGNGGSASTYASDSKTSSIANGNGYYVYSFYAQANVSYSITWVNSGSAKMAVSAGNSTSNYTYHFTGVTVSGRTVKLSSSATVYIKVMPYNSLSSNAGTFTLTVSTSNNNGKSLSLSQYAYYEGTSGGGSTTTYSDSATGSISYGNGYYIYYFSAQSNTTYTISWTNGSGSAMMAVSAGNSSTNTTYYKTAQTSTFTITPTSNATVYVKVVPYNSSDSYAGSFTLIVSGTVKVSLSRYSYSAGTKTSTTTALTLATCHTTDICDYTEAYIAAGSTKTYTFTVSSGYILNLQYYDSKNDSYKSICTNNSRTAGTAEPKVYKGGSLFHTIDTTGLLWTQGDGSGTYSIQITPTSSGYFALRAYTIPMASNVSSTITINSGAGSTYSDLTSYLFSSTNKVRYQKFYATAGKTYKLRWYDSETKANSSISSALTYTDGICLIYCSETGEAELYADDNEFNSFTAANTGYYIVVVSKAYSTVADNYVRYRLYTE